ncbi:MAG: response regulator [Chloroflexi bacterium]|nr:response regulator [Chloroflexota bacterium]
MRLLSEASPVATLAPSRRVRILVVDDEPGVLALLHDWLTAAGYQVDTALSAQEGLDLFNARRPALAIIDLLMPQVNGLELCKGIRAVSSTPIIVLTALNDVRHKVQALELGANDYVPKPTTRDNLLARVSAFLRHADAAS